MSRTMKTLALILVPLVSVSLVTWDLSWILPACEATERLEEYVRQMALRTSARLKAETAAQLRQRTSGRKAASADGAEGRASSNTAKKPKKREIFTDPVAQYPDRPTLKVHPFKEVRIDENGDLIVDCYIVARKGVFNGYHIYMRCPTSESPFGWKEVAYIWDTENDYSVPKTDDSLIAAKYKVASYNVSKMAGLTEKAKALLAQGIIPGTLRRAAMEFADRQLVLSGQSEGGGGTNCCQGDYRRCESDPIDIVSGYVVDECVDFSFPDRGIPVVLKRCYVSKESDIQTDLGYGWRHSYDMVIVQDPDASFPDIYYVWLNGEIQTLNKYSNGWASWPNTFLVIDDDNDYIYISDRDMTYKFEKPSDTGWGNEGRILEIKRVMEKTTDEIGYTYSFIYHTSGQDDGKLQYLRDTSDNTNILEFKYTDDESRRKLYQVENKNDAVLVTYTYDDADGNLTSATNPVSEAITYDYDDREEDPDLPLNHKIRSKQLGSYEGVGVFWSFDTEQDVVKTEDDDIFGNASGDSYRVFYNDTRMGDDASDNWFRMTVDYSHYGDTPGYVETQTLKDGNDWITRRFYEDQYYQYKRFTEIEIVMSESETYTINHTYGDFGVMTKRKISNEAGYYVETAYEYDLSNGRLAKMAVRKNTTASTGDPDLEITYDDDTGEVTYIKDAAGRGLFFEYDDNGYQNGWSRQLVSVCQISEDENQGTTSGYDECNKTEFDYYGRSGEGGAEWLLKEVTDPMGRVTEFDYNSDGTLDEIEDPIQGTISVSYSGLPDYVLGKPTKITVPGPNGNREMEFSYDNAGRITCQTFPKAKQSDSNRYKLGRTYNGDGLLSTLTQSYGETLVRTITYEYHDETDWLEYVYTDDNERKTKYEYFACGEIAQIIQVLAESGGEITSGRYIQFEYDNVFNVTKKRHFIDEVEDHEDYNDEVYAYYPDGSLATVTYEGKADGSDLDSTMIAYGYNSKNLLWTVDCGNDGSDEKTFTYTNSNLLWTVSNDAGDVAISYDEFNRVTSVNGVLTDTTDPDTVTYTWNSSYSQLSQIDGPNSYQQSFAYDALERLETITGDGSKETTYAYEDITGRLSQIVLPNGTTADYTYDDLDRVVTLANQLNAGELINSYTYAFNNKGLRSKVTYANGSWADFTYDVVGQLTDEHYKDAQGTSLLQLTYTYDKAGNRTEKKYDNDGSRVENYTVNGYNQLEAVAGKARGYTNVCGLVNEPNIDTVTVTNASLSEDATRVDLMHGFFIGRKLKIQDEDNNIEVTATDLAGNSTTAGSGGTYDFDQKEDIDVKYEYDVRGNMVLKQVKVGENYVDKERYFCNGDNLIEYVWYASGDNDDKHPHFIHDGLNRRVRIEYGTVSINEETGAWTGFTEATTKEYVFNGVVSIIEYDYNSTTEVRTVARQNYWGLDIVAGIGGLLYQKTGGTPAYYYYHYDGSGNVTAITDASKDVVALYEYDAFGNIISKCGELANDFTFSTQMAYGASGWSMYMFRNYSPRLGRWTQRDPLAPAGDLNPYIFCGNRAGNAVDVLGLLSDFAGGLVSTALQLVDTATSLFCWLMQQARMRLRKLLLQKMNLETTLEVYESQKKSFESEAEYLAGTWGFEDLASICRGAAKRLGREIARIKKELEALDKEIEAVQGRGGNGANGEGGDSADDGTARNVDVGEIAVDNSVEVDSVEVGSVDVTDRDGD